MSNMIAVFALLHETAVWGRCMPSVTAIPPEIILPARSYLQVPPAREVKLCIGEDVHCVVSMPN